MSKDTLETLDRAGLLHVVRGLVATGKVAPAVVAKQVRNAERVAALRRELARLEGRSPDENGTAPSVPAGHFGGTPPKEDMTAKMRESRERQGRYLGRLRKLTNAGMMAEYKRVRAVQADKGTEAAIKVADGFLRRLDKGKGGASASART